MMSIVSLQTTNIIPLKFNPGLCRLQVLDSVKLLLALKLWDSSVFCWSSSIPPGLKGGARTKIQPSEEQLNIQ
jgi:hypothetical protein